MYEFPTKRILRTPVPANGDSFAPGVSISHLSGGYRAVFCSQLSYSGPHWKPLPFWLNGNAEPGLA